MLQAAIAGLLAGYAIAVPVGAIAVLIIHAALTHGLRTAIGNGAIVVMGALIVASAFGA